MNQSEKGGWTSGRLVGFLEITLKDEPFSVAFSLTFCVRLSDPFFGSGHPKEMN